MESKMGYKTRRKLPYVIVRCKMAGVHAGELEVYDRATGAITLRNARRIWRWRGAASLSELAVYGAANPPECRFACVVERHELMAGDTCEIAYTQPVGEAMIRDCWVWRA